MLYSDYYDQLNYYDHVLPARLDTMINKGFSKIVKSYHK